MSWQAGDKVRCTDAWVEEWGGPRPRGEVIATQTPGPLNPDRTVYVKLSGPYLISHANRAWFDPADLEPDTGGTS